MTGVTTFCVAGDRCGSLRRMTSAGQHGAVVARNRDVVADGRTAQAAAAEVQSASMGNTRRPLTLMGMGIRGGHPLVHGVILRASGSNFGQRTRLGRRTLQNLNIAEWVMVVISDDFLRSLQHLPTWVLV